MNRRGFLKRSALAAAAPVAAGGAAQNKTASPNDRIGIGVIGCGGMGRMDRADL